jgi:hypothetical protein
MTKQHLKQQEADNLVNRKVALVVSPTEYNLMSNIFMLILCAKTGWSKRFNDNQQ